MSNIPNVLLADNLTVHENEVVPTSVVLEEFSREQAEKDISSYLSNAEVEAQLLNQGVSSKEISARLASLSEQEIRQLSSQVKEARAGGDILVTILIVLLIIFLVRRI